MKLQKAMNTLSAMMEDYEGGYYPDQEEALKLGIEALEAYRELRGCTAIDIEDIKRLPSETEE